MNSAATSTEPKRDLWLPVAIYALFGLAFWPLLHWLARTTIDQEQLTYPFLIFLGVGAYVVTERKEWRQLALRFDRAALLYISISAGLLLASAFYPWPLLFLGSFACAVASVVRFVFGQRALHGARSLFVAFLAFVGIALLFSALDWPLRFLAGEGARLALGLIGVSSELFLVATEEPKLILNTAAQPFEVAAECNGYGLLSSSLLLALLLMVYRRWPLLEFAAGLAFAIGLALFGNILRIVIIVVLAPHFENYMLLHEAAGITVFYGVLCIIFAQLSRSVNTGNSVKSPQTETNAPAGPSAA